MEILYCAGCNKKVAQIQSGSKLRKGMVALCADCETKRKAANIRMNAQKDNPFSTPLDDLFGSFRKK